MPHYIGLIALGANLSSSAGLPDVTLRKSIVEISKIPEVSLTSVSRFWRSAAVPAGSGPEFVNACAAFVTTKTAPEVLAALHEIEDSFGRVRDARWGARVLDLDLLALGAQICPDRATWDHWAQLDPARQQIIAPEQLILPHPRLHERGFVLLPLAEIAPSWVHPALGISVAQLAADLPDEAKRGLAPIEAPEQG